MALPPPFSLPPWAYIGRLYIHIRQVHIERLKGSNNIFLSVEAKKGGKMFSVKSARKKFFVRQPKLFLVVLYPPFYPPEKQQGGGLRGPKKLGGGKRTVFLHCATFSFQRHMH